MTIKEAEEKTGLDEALKQQQAIYQEQIGEIQKNQLLCRRMQENGIGIEGLSQEFLSGICKDQAAYLTYLEELKKRDRLRNRVYVFRQAAAVLVMLAGVLAAAFLVLEMQYRTVGAGGVAVSVVLLLILFALIGRVIYLSGKNL